MIDKEHTVAARNHGYELMMQGQAMMDTAQTDSDKLIADCVYYAGWAVYNMMIELEKKYKRGAS